MIEFSEGALTIVETIETNCIVWIYSLPDGELGPTGRILDDLEMLALSDGMPIMPYQVATRAQLVDLFKAIASQAVKSNLRPILHIDAHGTRDEGLLLAPSGERVPWDEILDLLRMVNTATRNNLVAIFALCFGLHAYKEVRLKLAVPAYLFVAPENEIAVGFLEEQTLQFYRRVCQGGNVTTALRETLAKEMQVFHCQGLLFESLSRYFLRFCRGGGRRARQEAMVTAILKRDGIIKPTPTQLKHLRQQIGPLLKPGQHVVDMFASRFLAGRPAAFTYANIQTAMNKARRPRRV